MANLFSDLLEEKTRRLWLKEIEKAVRKYEKLSGAAHRQAEIVTKLREWYKVIYHD